MLTRNALFFMLLSQGSLSLFSSSPVTWKISPRGKYFSSLVIHHPSPYKFISNLSMTQSCPIGTNRSVCALWRDQMCCLWWVRFYCYLWSSIKMPMFRLRVRQPMGAWKLHWSDSISSQLQISNATAILKLCHHWLYVSILPCSTIIIHFSSSKRMAAQ